MCQNALLLSYTLKNFRVRFDPEKGPMGPDPFPGQSDSDSGSVWPGFWVGLTPKWVGNKREIVSQTWVYLFPRNISSFPQHIVSFPRNIISLTRLIISFPRNIISFPRNNSSLVRNNIAGTEPLICHLIYWDMETISEVAVILRTPNPGWTFTFVYYGDVQDLTQKLLIRKINILCNMINCWICYLREAHETRQ